MKKLMPVFVVVIIVTLIIGLFLSLASAQKMIVIKEGNFKQLPLKIELNKYQDSDCGMVIESKDYLSEVVAKDGKTWFFHDHGGFVHWLSDKKFNKTAKIWVMSRDTHKWIDGREAFYSLNDITPMGYGFGAYEHNKKGYVDFETMSLKMLRGETMRNPLIKKQLLGK